MRRNSVVNGQIAVLCFVCICFWYLGYRTHTPGADWSVSQAINDGKRTVQNVQNALFEPVETQLADYEAAMATQLAEATPAPVPDNSATFKPAVEPYESPKEQSDSHREGVSDLLFDTSPGPTNHEDHSSHGSSSSSDMSGNQLGSAPVPFEDVPPVSGPMDDEVASHVITIPDAMSPAEPGMPTATQAKSINLEYKDRANEVMKLIMTKDDELPEGNDRLRCPGPVQGRFDYMKEYGEREVMMDTRGGAKTMRPKPKWFFALDMYECAPVLSRLISTIIETVTFLGPENCAVSFVEGRSHDGTYEILLGMRHIFESMGTQFYIQTNETNPREIDDQDFKERIVRLSVLRNMALEPLTSQPDRFHSDTTVLFINDVALCISDVLELAHQRIAQNAHMTCAMDWVQDGHNFYDSWIGRTMKGDLFIWQQDSGDFSHHAQTLFWNDYEAKSRRENGLTFAVFSCWNGAVAFTAKPLIEHGVRFRSHLEGECHLGEPIHFAKDLRKLGYDRVAVVGSVNLGYSDGETQAAKARWGSVNDWTSEQWLREMSRNNISEYINWGTVPEPTTIVCVEIWGATYVDVPWDQAIETLGM